MWVDFADESWREAREGAGVCSATALRRALPADLAEKVRYCSRILAGKVSGARLNDTQRNFKTYASGYRVGGPASQSLARTEIRDQVR